MYKSLHLVRSRTLLLTLSDAAAGVIIYYIRCGFGRWSLFISYNSLYHIHDYIIYFIISYTLLYHIIYFIKPFIISDTLSI